MKTFPLHICLGFILWMVVSIGCARDSRTLKWEVELVDVEERELRGYNDEALVGYRALEGRSPTLVDADLMRLAQARILARTNRRGDAIELFANIAHTAHRRSERARAHYEILDILDRAGGEHLIRERYRRLVLTYPDLMPGSNALLRLEASALRGDSMEVDQHLQWTAEHYERLTQTGLADNMLHFAAKMALRRYLAGDKEAESVARQLLQAVNTLHPGGNLAHDAMWDISYLEEITGDWEGTISTIRGIQRQRQKAVMLGASEHRYYWVGELRIARIMSEVLDKPLKAIKSYEFFVNEYRDHRWRDDALYWLACMHLRQGSRSLANRVFDEIRRKHPDSRYVDRIDAAIAEPRKGSCVPREFKREW